MDNPRSGHRRRCGASTMVPTGSMSTEEESESASDETQSADEVHGEGKPNSVFRAFLCKSRMLLPEHVCLHVKVPNIIFPGMASVARRICLFLCIAL
jgi:hypothetical protein